MRGFIGEVDYRWLAVGKGQELVNGLGLAGSDMNAHIARW